MKEIVIGSGEQLDCLDAFPPLDDLVGAIAAAAAGRMVFYLDIILQRSLITFAILGPCSRPTPNTSPYCRCRQPFCERIVLLEPIERRKGMEWGL